MILLKKNIIIRTNWNFVEIKPIKKLSMPMLENLNLENNTNQFWILKVWTISIKGNIVQWCTIATTVLYCLFNNIPLNMFDLRKIIIAIWQLHIGIQSVFIILSDKLITHTIFSIIILILHMYLYAYWDNIHITHSVICIHYNFCLHSFNYFCSWF